MHQELTWLLQNQERIRAAVRARGIRENLVHDVAQEVLVGAWRSLVEGRYRPPKRDLDNWRRWVMSIVRYQASNERRRAHHRYEHLRPDDELASVPGPDDAALHLEQRAQAAQLLGALRPERAAPLVSIFVLGLEGHEVARATSTPLSTVWSRVRMGCEDALALARRLDARDRRG